MPDIGGVLLINSNPSQLNLKQKRLDFILVFFKRLLRLSQGLIYCTEHNHYSIISKKFITFSIMITE